MPMLWLKIMVFNTPSWLPPTYYLKVLAPKKEPIIVLIIIGTISYEDAPIGWETMSTNTKNYGR
jgi:hypothetical protein